MPLEVDQGNTTTSGVMARRRQNQNVQHDVELMESAPVTDGEEDHDSEESKTIKATRAIQSIRYCCNMCFISVSFDVFTTIIDDDMWSKFVLRTVPLGWVDHVNILDKLSLLVFGGGLWRTSRLYSRMLNNLRKRMDGDDLLELFRTMSWIWGVVAVNYSIVGISSAASLPIHGRNGRFHFLFSRVSSTQSSLVFVCSLAVMHVSIRYNCRKAAMAETEKYHKKTGTRNTQKHSEARWLAAYRAYIIEAHCAGVCFVLASLALTKWIASFHERDIINHVFSVYDFLTPFTISALLFNLNRSFLRAAIAEVRGDSPHFGNRDEINYEDLFLAAIGFYNRVANTLKSATIFRLLPYATGLVMPYILMAVRKISPSLAARVLDSVGIQM